MQTLRIRCRCGWRGTSPDLCNRPEDPDNYSYCPRCLHRDTWARESCSDEEHPDQMRLFADGKDTHPYRWVQGHDHIRLA